MEYIIYKSIYNQLYKYNIYVYTKELDLRELVYENYIYTSPRCSIWYILSQTLYYYMDKYNKYIIYIYIHTCIQNFQILCSHEKHCA